jgi:hypothetical protein
LNTPAPPAITLVVSFLKGFKMLSERKTKLELAFGMLRNAVNLAFDHLFDENDTLFESKLDSFDEFVDELRRNYCAVHSVSTNLNKNLKAKREVPPPI